MHIWTAPETAGREACCLIVYRERASLVRDLGVKAETLYAVSNSLERYYRRVLLPKKEVEPVLRFMLGKEFLPYKLGIEGKQVYLNYRIHLSDITEASAAEIQADICRFSAKADELDNYMVDTFGCEFSEYSKTDAEA